MPECSLGLLFIPLKGNRNEGWVDQVQGRVDPVRHLRHDQRTNDRPGIWERCTVGLSLNFVQLV